MKKELKFVFVLGLVVLLSLTFVSANIFSDFWNWLNGKQEVSLSPFADVYVDNYCAQVGGYDVFSGVKISEGYGISGDQLKDCYADLNDGVWSSWSNVPTTPNNCQDYVCALHRGIVDGLLTASTTDKKCTQESGFPSDYLTYCQTWCPLNLDQIWSPSQSKCVSNIKSEPVCGNNLLEEGEECDTQQLGGQTCISIGYASGILYCGSNCKYDTNSCNIIDDRPSVCGDGLIIGSEQCDDGNTLSGDGCNGICQINSGWSCQGQPSVCTAIPQGERACGNGVIDNGEICEIGMTTSCVYDNLVGVKSCASNCLGWGSCSTTNFCGDSKSDFNGIDNIIGNADDEQCDDGNTLSGDGCSSLCKDENPEGDDVGGDKGEQNPYWKLYQLVGTEILHNPESRDFQLYDDGFIMAWIDKREDSSPIVLRSEGLELGQKASYDVIDKSLAESSYFRVVLAPENTFIFNDIEGTYEVNNVDKDHLILIYQCYYGGSVEILRSFCDEARVSCDSETLLLDNSGTCEDELKSLQHMFLSVIDDRTISMMYKGKTYSVTTKYPHQKYILYFFGDNIGGILDDGPPENIYEVSNFQISSIETEPSLCPLGYDLIQSSTSGKSLYDSESCAGNEYVENVQVSSARYEADVPYREDGRNVCRQRLDNADPSSIKSLNSGGNCIPITNTEPDTGLYYHVCEIGQCGVQDESDDVGDTTKDENPVITKSIDDLIKPESMDKDFVKPDICYSFFCNVEPGEEPGFMQRGLCNWISRGACFPPEYDKSPGIVTGVAYVQFDEFVKEMSAPQGRVIAYADEEKDDENYGSLFFTSNLDHDSTDLVSDSVTFPLYATESVSFNLLSGGFKDNSIEGENGVYTFEMILRDGEDVYFKSTAYCDITSGIDGEKKTIIEGKNLLIVSPINNHHEVRDNLYEIFSSEVYPIDSDVPSRVNDCDYIFTGSEKINTFVEIIPNDHSTNKGIVRLLGNEYRFDPFVSNNENKKVLTLEFKTSRREDNKLNFILKDFDSGTGNADPSLYERQRERYIAHWDKGSYLKDIYKWSWNTGTEDKNVLLQARIIDEAGNSIGYFEDNVEIESGEENKGILKPTPINGVSTVYDPERGMLLPFNAEGSSCYTIEFYKDYYFYDEGFDICVE